MVSPANLTFKSGEVEQNKKKMNLGVAIGAIRKHVCRAILERLVLSNRNIGQ